MSLDKQMQRKKEMPCYLSFSTYHACKHAWPGSVDLSSTSRSIPSATNIICTCIM